MTSCSQLLLGWETLYDCKALCNAKYFARFGIMNGYNLVENDWLDSGVVVKGYIYSNEEFTSESFLIRKREFEV